MKPLLTPSQMYQLEQMHFQSGMSSLTAMENAALAFVESLEQYCGSLYGKTAIVACGSGNNGGDGYAIARLLKSKQASVRLLPMTNPSHLHGDALINARRALDDEQIPSICLQEAERPDIWVDALFGIGLNRPISELYSPLIKRMEEDRMSGSIVASVDIPSGLNAETGRIEGFAVQATLTITFQYAKTGHYLLDGMDHTGTLIVRSIGMTRFVPNGSIHLIEPADPSVSFPRRLHNTHKGTYGHLLVIAGSFGMTGAALFTAHAALRTGAGLVSVACPRSVVPMMQTSLPAAMCIPLPEQDGAVADSASVILKDALQGKDAVVIGPGLSRRASADAVRLVLESGLPAVIDADALNLISASSHLKSLFKPHHIITPHPGEAARLCTGLTGCMLKDSASLSRLNATVLLKGAASVIFGENKYISVSGTPGMATGGSGDVLSGIIGALLAAGVAPETAAWCGSEIHGQCGEQAARRLGDVSLIAPDLIEELPAVIRTLYR